MRIKFKNFDWMCEYAPKYLTIDVIREISSNEYEVKGKGYHSYIEILGEIYFTKELVWCYYDVTDKVSLKDIFDKYEQKRFKKNDDNWALFFDTGKNEWTTYSSEYGFYYGTQFYRKEDAKEIVTELNKLGIHP